jgi:SAM-dependent methyltransferase
MKEEFFRPYAGLEIGPYLKSEDMQGLHHMARYIWVSLVLEQITPGRLIDIACGAGYGSYMLAKKYTNWCITGVDYDPQAIDYATSNYKSENLDFTVGNMETWKSSKSSEPIELGCYEVILSFDTIEHLDHPEIALLKIVDHLSHHGMLILSTPVSFPETNLKPDWWAHKIEYGAADLVNLMKRFFKQVILPGDELFPRIDFWTDIVNKDKTRYLNVANPIICKEPIKY